MEIFGEWIQQYRLKRCLTKLQDENPDVRREAIKILGEIGNPEAITHLIALLREWDWNVQHQATETLGNIGVPAIMPLAKVLEEEDYSARSKALEILERIGGIHVVEPLIKALGDKDDTGFC